MLTPRSHFIDRNGIRLHLVEWGSERDRPLLLVHGGSAHAHWWAFVVPALAATHRVLAIDLRGHGDSAWADPPNYAIETHADDIAAVAAALDLTDLTVIGHSLGGLATLASVRALAPRLSGVVLVDTMGRLGAKSLRYLNALSHWPHPVYKSLEDGVRRFRLLSSANATPAPIRDYVARHALRASADGTWTLKFDRRALAIGQPIDLTERLREIDVPTLIVRGALSTHVSSRTLSELQATLRIGVTAEIAGAHHHVMLDAPDDLARALLEFLATETTGHRAHQPIPSG